MGGYLGSIFDIIFGTLFGFILGIILAALSGVIFRTFFGYPKGGFINQGKGLTFFHMNKLAGAQTKKLVA